MLPVGSEAPGHSASSLWSFLQELEFQDTPAMGMARARDPAFRLFIRRVAPLSRRGGDFALNTICDSVQHPQIVPGSHSLLDPLERSDELWQFGDRYPKGPQVFPHLRRSLRIGRKRHWGDVVESNLFQRSDELVVDRSEERRVGKEGRCRWSPYH